MLRMVGMILAGGMGSRLNILAQRRAKPAVPFAGTYRIIDFTLSNVMRAGITRVGVATQYRPKSLMEHLGNGQAWDLWGKTKVLRVLPPFQGADDADWYRGTADAVYQNIGFVRQGSPSDVLILSGDHIYSMDFRDMARFHVEKRADLTIAVMPVPWAEARRFGLLRTDATGRVVEFQEKPPEPKSNLASMGIYIFSTAVLEEGLAATCPRGRHDFGKDVIPGLFTAGRRIFAYPFSGYWRDVGTLQSYWDANMDALRADSGMALGDWQVRTNGDADGLGERPPAWLGTDARVRTALVSRGCVVEGTVERSILSPGVRVMAGAVVRDSIVMHDTVVGAASLVDRSIVDKGVRIGAGCEVGHGPDDVANREFPDHLDSGLTVLGKEAHVPDGARVGRNCLIFPGVDAAAWDGAVLAAGATLRPGGGGPR